MAEEAEVAAHGRAFGSWCGGSQEAAEKNVSESYTPGYCKGEEGSEGGSSVPQTKRTI
jgi:hypothetical protein